MKKFLSILLSMLLLFSFVGCTDGGKDKTLSTPANVTISETGLISWDEVENATGYVVVINGVSYSVEKPPYQVDSIVEDFTYSVAAKADGYKDSAPTQTQTFTGTGEEKPVVTVGIAGGSEVKSGQSITLTATVDGTDDQGVVWSVSQGSEYASIDAAGKLTAEEVTGDKIIEVTAASNADPTAVAKKTVTVVARPNLTQAMLDTLVSDKISFEGYIDISLYTIGLVEKLHSTTKLDVKTAMDGANWYAEYQSGAVVSTKAGLYYKNHNNLACQVGVSFTNEESFEPMLDDDGFEVAWEDAGLYNNFKGLKAADFRFNEKNWRYEYVGSDADLPARMIASANPYDFKPTNLALVISEGEIMGIYSKSEPDYTIAESYKAIQELTVAVNTGDTVEVPTITKYSHDVKHDPLTAAIANMRKLNNYTVDYTQMVASRMGGNGVVESGFVETITPTDCYYDPFTVSVVGGQQVRTFTEDTYGYRKITDTLYNVYSKTESGYEANRAFAGDFKKAKPTFEFAAEIFTQCYEASDGTITYYVDEPMCGVASTLYYGVGNDIALYGIFAAKGQTSPTSSFTPYVVVKDGYIVEAVFYFDVGSLYGVVELKYEDFGTAALPDDVTIDFEARQLPSAWSDVNIIVSGDIGGTEKDEEVNALEYLKTFYGDDAIGEKLPFFGDVLGDTYGFGLTTFHRAGGTTSVKSAIVFYYDVPLDVDYTIESSLKAIAKDLLEKGFTKNKYGEFSKGNMVIAPIDSSLDLTIYVWKNS